MSKSFSNHERELIKEKLQECCEECWGKYGYKKTNVGELCKMAGISTGAFYLFYSSKELLFVDTMFRIQERFNTLIEQIMPENPTRTDFANVFKRIFHELEKMPWVLKLNEDYNIIIRKLPEDFLETCYKQDVMDLAAMSERYKLNPKIRLELLASISYILGFSSPMMPIVGEHYAEAMDLIIDSIVEKYFN